MPPEDGDDLILRHLDGETSAEESARVTRLLAENRHFRSRFSHFVSLVAHLREILDDRLRDSPVTIVENGMSTQPSAITRGAPPARPEEAAGRSKGFLADMNLDLGRVYLNAVVGGFGGLAGWVLMFVALSIFPFQLVPGWLMIWVQHAVIGPLIGLSIGFAIGGAEGLLSSRSLKRMVRGGAVGAVLGAVGGLVGLLLGEAIFRLFGGGLIARSIGWGIFGMLVGISEGVAHRMPVKVRYGILGGLLGGLIGGSTYAGLMATFSVLGFKAAGQAWGNAIGLIILGACIGFLVNLVETLLRKAWLFFLTGRLEGQTRTLDSSRPYTLGSDPSCTIVLPQDPTVLPVHAEIVFEDEAFQVRPRDGEVVIRRDGFDQSVLSHKLEPGDRILLGDTRCVFRNVEGKGRKVPS